MKKKWHLPVLLSPGNKDEAHNGNYFFQGKLYNKSSADIVGKKKLLMLLRSNFSFSHINFGSYTPSKMNIAYISQIITNPSLSTCSSFFINLHS